MRAGSTSAAVAHEAGNASTVLRNTKVAITDFGSNLADLYDLRMDENFNLVFDQEALAEKMVLKDNSHGKSARLLKSTLGSNRVPINISDDPLSQLLDLNQTGAPTLWQKLKEKVNKFDNPD